MELLVESTGIADCASLCRSSPQRGGLCVAIITTQSLSSACALTNVRWVLRYLSLYLPHDSSSAWPGACWCRSSCSRGHRRYTDSYQTRPSSTGVWLWLHSWCTPVPFYHAHQLHVVDSDPAYSINFNRKFSKDFLYLITSIYFITCPLITNLFKTKHTRFIHQ